MQTIKMKVTGSQQVVGQEPMVTELTTEGLFYTENNAYYFQYDESPLSGMTGSTTQLISNGHERLVLKRKGPQSSTILEFEAGQSFTGSYDTAYGSFIISVKTLQVASDFDQNGRGRISLKYLMSLGKEEESINQLEILIF